MESSEESDASLSDIESTSPPAKKARKPPALQKRRSRSLVVHANKVWSENEEEPDAGVGTTEEFGARVNLRRKTEESVTAKMSVPEMVQVYHNCVQLANESKINAKNAFCLKLLEVMDVVVKEQKDDGAGTKFQTASHALYAGSKIYACRVDVVHSDTMGVVGVIDRLKKNQRREGDEEDVGGDGDGDGGLPGKKKRRRKLHRASKIERNKARITIAEKDLLKPITSSHLKFHEGQLGISVFMTHGFIGPEGMVEIGDKANHHFLEEYQDKDLEKIAVASQEIEHEAETMRACLLKLDAIDINSNELVLDPLALMKWDETGIMNDSLGSNRDKYDMHKEVLELPSFHGDPDDFDLDEPFDVDGAADMSLGGDNFAMNPEVFHDIHSMNLDPMTTSYSFYDKELVKAWHNIDRRRRIGRFRHRVGAGAVGLMVPDKKVRNKKQKKEIDFSDFGEVPPSRNWLENLPDDIRAKLKPSKASTIISDKKLSSWTTEANNIVDNHGYNAQLYISYFVLNVQYLKTGKDKNNGVMSKEVENEAHDLDADHGGNDASFGGDGDAFFGGSTPDDADDGIVEEVAAAGHVGMYEGDNLIDAPQKVEYAVINFEKKAKRINMRLLKQSVWYLLCKQQLLKVHEGETEETLHRRVGKNPELCESMGEFTVSFAEIYRDLPALLPKVQATDLSVHLAFIAFLHIVNDHSLTIIRDSSYGDFNVKQVIRS
ncbi:unnamed protein product [Notodromas monacha]|uniref:Condensin complex subunit 2 n=1 Tax=Notodromas monacha TaxID=399045 RepID=A0A7R9BGC7_9CRUS|nr:unnamed protein product [Notodromas monacha]CAG0914971.1 unnamed protein product [Notodromas monacha]